MPKLNLQLPTIQNWNCHNCGGCCKQHAILVTPEEQQRIENQGWENRKDFDHSGPLFVKAGGSRAKPQMRIAHQPDGACLFLDEKGLCKIHAEFGEEAKPLACRVYPYAFHPNGNKITVSLRFSCPSVVENKGQSTVQNQAEILKIAKDVVPDGFKTITAPNISNSEQRDWRDFQQFNKHIVSLLETDDVPLTVRLLRILDWLDFLSEAKFVSLTTNQIDEILEVFSSAVCAKQESIPSDIKPPTRWAKLYLRLLAGQYARKDNYSTVDAGLKGRWKLFISAMKLTRGTGTLPAFHNQLKSVPFSALEKSFGSIPQEAEEILSRYLEVKVRGLHFCGRAYYNVPFIEGAYSQILIIPAILYIAKWIASSKGRTEWIAEDIQQALALADHHHGYSPIFGSRSFRNRVKQLAMHKQIEALLLHHS